jgi:hypothetical protein
MNKKSILAVFGIFMACALFAAEPLVVDVWPGETPGDAGIPGRASYICNRRPRLRRPAGRKTSVELDAALRQLAALPWILKAASGPVR